MITKITRRKLRQLIKEAFISGPHGTKHIPDEDYPYSRLEKQLGGDSKRAHKLLSLAQTYAGEELDPETQIQVRELEKALQIYDEDGKPIKTDLIKDTQQMNDQYDHDTYQLFASKVKKIADSTLPDAYIGEHPAYEKAGMLHVSTNDYQGAQRFVQEIKKQGLEKYLSYNNNELARIAAHKGTYIVGPNDKTKYLYEIVFNLDAPNWWRNQDSEAYTAGFPS